MDEQLSDGEVTLPRSPTSGNDQPLSGKQKRDDDDNKHDDGGHEEKHDGRDEGDQKVQGHD